MCDPIHTSRRKDKQRYKCEKPNKCVTQCDNNRQLMAVPPETCGDISEISRKKLRGKMPQIAGNIADFVKYCGIIVVKLRKLRPICYLYCSGVRCTSRTA